MTSSPLGSVKLMMSTLEINVIFTCRHLRFYYWKDTKHKTAQVKSIQHTKFTHIWFG